MSVVFVKRLNRLNVLAVASVLTMLVGIVMAFPGGPGGSGPKRWNCTGQGCTTPPHDYRTCDADASACCCYDSSTHLYTSSCVVGGDCASGCQICV